MALIAETAAPCVVLWRRGMLHKQKVKGGAKIGDVVDFQKFKDSKEISKRAGTMFLMSIPAGVAIYEVTATEAGVLVCTSDGVYIAAWDGSGATKL